MTALLRRWRRRLTGPLGRRLLLALAVAATWLAWTVTPPWPLREWLATSGEPVHWLLTPDRARLACVTWRNPGYVAPTGTAKARLIVPARYIAQEGRVWVWDLATGHERLTLRDDHEMILNPVALHVAPDSSWLLISSNFLIVRDTETGEGLWSTGIVPRSAFGSYAPNHVVSADGRYVACLHPGGGSDVLLTATGRVAFPLDKHAWPLAFAPDGRTLVTIPNPSGFVPEDEVTRRDELTLWDTTSGQPRRRVTLKHPPNFPAPPAAAFSPDGRWLAIRQIPDQTHVVDLLDLRTGEWAAELHLDLNTSWQAARRGLSFSPDGTLLVALATDGSQRVWDMTQTPPRAIDISGTFPRIVRMFEVQTTTMVYLADSPAYPIVAPDGARFVGPAPAGDTLAFRETAAPERPVLAAKKVQQVDPPQFAPDGRSLAVLHAAPFLPLWQQAVNWAYQTVRRPAPYVGEARYDLAVFDATTGAERGHIGNLPPGTHLIGFGPDGRTAWTMTHTPDPPAEGQRGGTGDGTLRVQEWAVPTGWPPLWLVAVTTLGVVVVVVDWRRARRRAMIGGPAS
jgi:WD40 repeat protein